MGDPAIPLFDQKPDVELIEGKEDELLGRFQKKLGKGKDEIRKMIADLWAAQTRHFHSS